MALRVVLLASLICFASAGSVGDRLLRTFLLFSPQPLTIDAAIEQGWRNVSNSPGCDPDFGIMMTSVERGPDKGDSATLYFTAGGQLAGFGSRHWGHPPASLIPTFWRPAAGFSTLYDVSIRTRDTSLMCSGATAPERLGDRLVISASNMSIPLTMPDAEQHGWVMGNCIGQMGIHHAFDLNAPGSQTWNASSLVPVLPMFNTHTHAVSAVLFATPKPQESEPFGMWEGPFFNFLFCKNWCENSGCDFPGIEAWSTMHFMFTDPAKNTCRGAPCHL